MKRISSLYLCLLAALMSFAHDFEVGGIYYDITSPSTVAVTFKGESYDKFNNEYTDAVAIPETVTYGSTTYSVTAVGVLAFFNCSLLTSVEFPASMTRIGDYAFERCRSLASVELPASVTSIGEGAFKETAWYDDQPDGLLYAGHVAYRYKGTMPDDTEIIIEDGTTGIAEYAFSGCTGLTSVTMPASVVNIGDRAFRDCSGLTSVIIGDGVTSIGDNAFQGCSGLTSVTVGGSVASVGSEPFQGCTGLTSVTVLGEDVGTWFRSMASVREVTMGDGVTRISDGAFCRCTGLTSVSIGSSVTDIGGFAFEDCSSLTSVEIPASVTHIGGAAFSGCTGLTSVVARPAQPVVLNETVFSSFIVVDGSQPSIYKQATLYVPKGSKPAYESAVEWKLFKDVVEMEPTDIEALEDAASTIQNVASQGIYTLSGTRLSGDAEALKSLPSGVYIVDGKKRVVK